MAHQLLFEVEARALPSIWKVLILTTLSLWCVDPPRPSPSPSNISLSHNWKFKTQNDNIWIIKKAWSIGKSSPISRSDADLEGHVLAIYWAPTHALNRFWINIHHNYMSRLSDIWHHIQYLRSRDPINHGPTIISLVPTNPFSLQTKNTSSKLY